MEDKNIKKFNELEEDFFTTCPNWTYEWGIGSVRYCLDWDFDKEWYGYYVNCKFIEHFKDIYEALDGVVIDGKTLRQMLLETDFDFEAIL